MGRSFNMEEVLTGIGLTGMVVSLGLIIYSMIRRNGLTKKYVVSTIIFFLVFGLGLSLNDGLLGLYEFISTSGFVLCIMFIWLIIYSVIRKNGKGLKYFILMVLSFVAMMIGYGLAEGVEGVL